MFIFIPIYNLKDKTPYFSTAEGPVPTIINHLGAGPKTESPYW